MLLFAVIHSSKAALRDRAQYKVGKMITRINEKWDPISWGWLSQNTFHTTSTVLVIVITLAEFTL